MTMCGPHQWQEGWICPVCEQPRGADGLDPCLQNLPGVKYACCGHGGKGMSEGYIYFENGVRVGIVVTSISYDDHRPSVIVPFHDGENVSGPKED